MSRLDRFGTILIVLLVAVIWFYRRRPSLSAVGSSVTSTIEHIPKKWVLPPLLVAAILSILFAATIPDDNLHVSFLDVGQGDAILIQTPAHQNILVDGGPSSRELNMELGKRCPSGTGQSIW